MKLHTAIERLYDRNVGVTPTEEDGPHEGSNKYWYVKVLGPRRFNGETELLDLAAKNFLLTEDQTFLSDAEGLKWRS